MVQYAKITKFSMLYIRSGMANCFSRLQKCLQNTPSLMPDCVSVYCEIL